MAFTSKGIKTFLSSEYKVTPASDRMGIRLSGPAIEHRGGPDIITDPTVAGAIQVPGDGQPILLLPDRQTTGGYAKIAAVITADLDRAGQLRPGDGVRFLPVEIEEAHRAYREYTAKLERLRRSL
jgi:allophanate hydrolase subunit 2